jgi:thiosulfate dehydrogenase [quinone] large subunit
MDDMTATTTATTTHVREGDDHMATTDRPRRRAGGGRTAPAPVRPTATGKTAKGAAAYVWAIIRLALGWVFVWAFVDKLFGLGHETPSERAWIEGGSPTEGFLANAPTGPFENLYKGVAGAAWADWLFMIGLAGIGVALILGIGIRIAAATGGLMLVMMWSAVLPPENNLFMDDHIVYALMLAGLAVVGAGDTLGLGRWWGGTKLVRRYPVLR